MANPLACPYPECASREFRDKTGITRHLNAAHPGWMDEQVGTDWRQEYEFLYHDVAKFIADEEGLLSELAQTLLLTKKRFHRLNTQNARFHDAKQHELDHKVIVKINALLTVLYKRADAQTAPRVVKATPDPSRCVGGQADLGSFFARKQPQEEK